MFRKNFKEHIKKLEREKGFQVLEIIPDKTSYIEEQAIKFQKRIKEEWRWMGIQHQKEEEAREGNRVMTERERETYYLKGSNRIILMDRIGVMGHD